MPALRTSKHVRQEIIDLGKKKADLVAQTRVHLDKAKTEKRGLSAEEDVAVKSLRAQIDLLAIDGDMLDGELADMAATAEREAKTTEVKAAHDADPKHGFKHGPDMLMAIFESHRSGKLDPRLHGLRASGLQATAGSDEHSTQNDPYGGFLIPRSVLAPGVLQMPVETNPFMGKTRRVDMGAARQIDFNARVDKDHSTSVSGGLRVYRRVETGTVATSRMQIEQVTLRKNTLMGDTYATEELIAASPEAFTSLLASSFGDEFAAVVFEEMLNGNGTGRYQGIANSGALLTIDKETGQAADTIVYENVVKMMSRCWGYSNAIWYANHGCIPALATMKLPGNLAPVFQNANGINTLLGRPIYFGERAAAIGDLGDLILVNPMEYLEDSGAPIQSLDSIHVRFLERERTFLFFTDNAGAPWWRSVLTPKRGPTMSPFVYLQAR